MRISDWSSDVCSSDLHSVHGVSRGRPFRSAVGQAFDPMRWQDAWPPPHRLADRKRHAHPAPSGRGSSAAPWGQWRGEYPRRSEEHTSELQSLMRISYAVFCLKKKTQNPQRTNHKNPQHPDLNYQYTHNY